MLGKEKEYKHIKSSRKTRENTEREGKIKKKKQRTSMQK